MSSLSGQNIKGAFSKGLVVDVFAVHSINIQEFTQFVLHESAILREAK